MGAEMIRWTLWEFYSSETQYLAEERKKNEETDRPDWASVLCQHDNECNMPAPKQKEYPKYWTAFTASQQWKKRDRQKRRMPELRPENIHRIHGTYKFGQIVNNVRTCNKIAFPFAFTIFLSAFHCFFFIEPLVLSVQKLFPIFTGRLTNRKVKTERVKMIESEGREYFLN